MDNSIVKTVFTATLVQDSALSVGGVDRQSTADQPLAMIGETPVLSGRGLKGAAVAMARRFFRDLPRSISEHLDREEALVRSAWEFRDAKAERFKLGLRAGVGLLHKTGARAQGVLCDREVVEAGARWPLTLCVDWYWAEQAKEDPERVERILHYVLAEHWANGRCWLGGGAARGLGWCHLEDLKAYRLDQEAYDRWRRDESVLPEKTAQLTPASPTRSWYFRGKTIELCAGEYFPKGNNNTTDKTSWGLDMLAIGPHSQSVQHQPFVDAQHWVLPRWATPTPKLETLETNRAIAMEGGAPLLPGSSLRGPLRHAASRLRRQAGEDITDPNACNRRDAGQKSGEQATDSPHETSTREHTSAPADSVAQLFGTVATSSRLLICDGHAKPDAKGNRWLAARMHMHAEDEFSAGSYGSAKREAVRLLRATFQVRLVLEGPDRDAIEKDCAALDKLIALGELGHLPLGGHKTHGAGGGRWVCEAKQWSDQGSSPTDPSLRSLRTEQAAAEMQTALPERKAKREERKLPPRTDSSTTLQHSVQTTPLSLEHELDTLGQAAKVARQHLGEHLTCWWCEPKINLDHQVVDAAGKSRFDPFGTTWNDAHADIPIDEAVFFAREASVRFARTRHGMKAQLLRVLNSDRDIQNQGATASDRVSATPRSFYAWRLDEKWRFPSLAEKTGTFLFREWRHGDAVLGHTATADTSEAK